MDIDGIYIYTYLYTYVPMYLYTPIYLYTYIPIYLFTYVPMYLYTSIPLYLYTYISVSFQLHQPQPPTKKVRLCKLSDEGSSSRSSGMMVSFRSDLSGVVRGPFLWPKFGALIWSDGPQTGRDPAQLWVWGLWNCQVTSNEVGFCGIPPQSLHIFDVKMAAAANPEAWARWETAPDIASPLPPAESHSTGRIWSSETAWCWVFPENGISPGRKDAKWD